MPQTSSIIGHKKQISELLRDIEKETLSHAYLFCGKRHLGKLSIAKWFIEKLLVKDAKEKDHEKILQLLKKGTHPDLLILDQLWMDGICTDWSIIARTSSAPQQHRAKAKVKSDVIGIDDIRALQKRLYETPQGNYMCCIIRSIERLHITAANALLKILEEPPPRVLFLFTTETPSSIPETLVSRMRVMQFSPVSRSELLPYIQKHNQEDQELLLGMAQGAPGIILRCGEDADRLRKERTEHLDAVHFLATRSSFERFKKLRTIFEDKNASSTFLRQAFLHLQKKLRSKDAAEASSAATTCTQLLSMIRISQTNVHPHLLAAHTAFHTLSSL